MITITAAAIKCPDGSVLTGLTHGHISDEYHIGSRSTGFICGFVDSDGKFYNREEAARAIGSKRRLAIHQDVGKKVGDE